MKKASLLLLLFVLLFKPAFSQVTVSPSYPTVNESITITYDATQGESTLQGATSVYMHSGVVLEPNGTSWSHVVGTWGADDGVGEMTKVNGEENKWEITLTPASYYSLTNDVVAHRLAFVFRNADGTKEGKSSGNSDIFYDINPGFTVQFTMPEKEEIFVDQNSTLNLSAQASETAALSLSLDDVVVASTTGQTQLDYTFDATQTGTYTFVIEADNGNVIQSDLLTVHVQAANVIESIPTGVKDGINYIDDHTVVLSLLAPNKSFAHVLGDFNNWQVDPNYRMKLSPDGEHFWLQIDNLEAGKEYIFQYLVDGEIRIADPYTDKVSDPWDDQYISETVYPGLIDYPQGKTEYRASVLQTAQEPYVWNVTDFQKPAKEDLVVYELLVRDFDEQHTYKAVADRLDYLKSLGVNAIELMPVNEFEGNISWGYNPNFYFAPDKYYGTKDDLKAFIDLCHENGMAVILDIVLNHSFHSAPMVRLYQQEDSYKPSAENPWYRTEHNFENTAAHWGADFDHESAYTQDFVDSVNTYWLTEYKVDGFRFDFTKGFSNNYKDNSDSWASLYDGDRVRLLKRMTDEIRKVDSEAFIIFEHLAENTEEKELADYGILLWGNMMHAYGQAVKGESSDLSGVSYKSRGWSQPNLVSYMESHDEQRLMYEALNYGKRSTSYNASVLDTALQRMKLAAAFYLTVPGPKMIWQFGERGYEVSIDHNGRTGEKDPQWADFDTQQRLNLYKTYAELIKLKTTLDVFETTDFSQSLSGLVKSIHLNSTELNVTIIGNFSVVEKIINPEFQHTGLWYDYFTGSDMQVDNVNETFTLMPGEFHILTDKPLDTPEQGIVPFILPTDVVLSAEELTNGEFSLAPNPVTDRMKIQLPKAVKTAEVVLYSIHGEKVKAFSLKPDAINTMELNLENYPQGIYILHIQAGEQEFAKRIIKY